MYMCVYRSHDLVQSLKAHCTSKLTTKNVLFFGPVNPIIYTLLLVKNFFIAITGRRLSAKGTGEELDEGHCGMDLFYV